MNLEQLALDIEEIKLKLNGGPQVVGKFHKVSLEQFTKDYTADRAISKEQARKVYEDVLTLPIRSSVGSAGHDLILTEDISLKPGESVQIFTGIRAEMLEGWVLIATPRSGLGTKFRMQLNNTVGVIDSDYFEALNEGHIMAKFTNDSKDGKTLVLEAGDRFMQAIFIPYGITSDDVPAGKRLGGHGSSGLK